MNVKDLCLGALTFGDASGYDLKKIFETTFSHFCTAGFGSIYPALAELANEGLVCCTDEAHGGRPDRKLYHLTAAGRASFVASLCEAAPMHRVKSDFLLVLYFGHLLPAGHLDAFLDQRIRTLEEQIALLKTCEHTAQDRSAGSRLVHGYGLAVMSAACDYLREHGHELVAAAGGPHTHAHHHTARASGAHAP